MICPYFPQHSKDQGDERLFNQLIETYAPYLFADIVAIIKCRHSAADILQDTFLKLWAKRQTITDENPGGWLYRVAIHAAYKHLKKESRKRKLLNEFNSFSDPDGFTAENCLLRKEQQHQLKDIFTRLPQMQKKVFWLSREAGMSRDEIASTLNISHNTVKVHLTRAQRFFKEQLSAVGVFLFFAGFNIFCFGTGNTKSGWEDIYNTEEIYKMPSGENKYAQHNTNKPALFMITDIA
ncbi:RNA polymerase sigma factor [Pseudobacter ginsenosidimutans]|uniref:RNA polymerase sigma-70 factor (ECF subfamily) n=1 Tax=Pseudobacter ginsenosidimutans TaxID=661488 RepID=A0A4Q7MDN6_9BACT|nr:RNA polymerase sigma factor [Pseudobacter ginsenosidimutans]RZS65483.1 RNA polymerase sigma-70 factor (ECF subfamily) [Pseudobacter ginsenosidimutans]